MSTIKRLVKKNTLKEGMRVASLTYPDDVKVVSWASPDGRVFSYKDGSGKEHASKPSNYYATEREQLPVIFLDIDETVTSQSTYLIDINTSPSFQPPGESTFKTSLRRISVESMKLLELLCWQYEARIVTCTSVVRCHAELYNLAYYCMQAFDFPMGYWRDICTSAGGHARQEHIRRYIEKHGIENYVIIDDAGENMYPEMIDEGHFVQPKGWDGFRAPDYIKACEILSK